MDWVDTLNSVEVRVCLHNGSSVTKTSGRGLSLSSPWGSVPACGHVTVDKVVVVAGWLEANVTFKKQSIDEGFKKGGGEGVFLEGVASEK
jgi:hypothetical protein